MERSWFLRAVGSIIPRYPVVSEDVDWGVKEPLLTFSSEKNPFSSSTKSFSSPRRHPFTIAFLPCDWSSKRLPSCSRSRIFDPSEEINIAEDEKIGPRSGDSETFCQND